MNGYRSRIVKPTVLLWALIVLADAGGSVASGLTALLTAFTVGGVLVLMLLVARSFAAVRQPVPVPVPVPVRRPIPARRPVRLPAAPSVYRRDYAVPRLSVRHHTS